MDSRSEAVTNPGLERCFINRLLSLRCRDGVPSVNRGGDNGSFRGGQSVEESLISVCLLRDQKENLKALQRM